MEHKKSNHSWDEEEIKKYLEQMARDWKPQENGF